MLIADWGTTCYIEGSVLEDVIKDCDFTAFDVEKGSIFKTPANTNVDMMLTFILNYCRHAAPKDEVKRNVVYMRQKKKQELGRSPDAESESIMAECHLDFLTSSDVAYTLWQYLNSYEDWRKKINDKESGDLKYVCNTRWTKKRNGEVLPPNSEGMLYYGYCLKYARKLKSLDKDKMDGLRCLCNLKAMKMGLLHGYKKKSQAKANWEDAETRESIPVFSLELDDVDDVHEVDV